MAEEKTGEQLAIEHWTWLETLLRRVYIDALIHGHKHGEDSKEADTVKW